MFQGGGSVELLGAGGKDPAAQWKLTGKVRREYDKLSKVYLFTMEGSALATKMSLPKTSKPLGLTQRYLVFQICIPPAKAISVEVGVTDTQGARRRIVISSAFRGAVVHQLHAQIPLLSVTRETWLNWVFDIAALVDGSFGQRLNWRTLDSICLSGTCKLRRVFTMKEPPIPSYSPSLDFEGGVEIPTPYFVPGSTTEYFAAQKTPSIEPTKPPGRAASAGGGKKAPPTTPKAPGPTRPKSTPSSNTLESHRSETSIKSREVTDSTKKPAPISPPKSILRSTPQHSRHIQARIQAQFSPSTSIFTWAADGNAVKSTTIAKASTFQSWEDDDSPTKDELKPDVIDAIDDDDQDPGWNNEQASHSLVKDEMKPTHSEELRAGDNAVGKPSVADLAGALSLELSSSPFFKIPSPTITSHSTTARPLSSKFKSWEDDLSPSKSKPQPVSNQTQELPQHVATETIPQRPATSKRSLFEWNDVELRMESTTAPPPEDSQQASQDSDEELSFDITNDLEKSFDLTPDLEESLPSTVQMHSPPPRPSKDKTILSITYAVCIRLCLKFMQARVVVGNASAHEEPPWYAMVILDLEADAVVESTDWTQSPSVELVYDPILHCYHDPSSNKYYELK
ncbi:hypothetical protein LEN26_021123 [Aphanomyces euteiches]|nr:hypothetical protein LEN26_021123 [Aphanomyces euteiches]